MMLLVDHGSFMNLVTALLKDGHIDYELSAKPPLTA